MTRYPRIKTYIDGHLISYFELGESSAQALLILHGWGLSASVYLRLANLLAEKGFHVIVVDLPDFGFSFAPKEKWSFEHYADFISNFIKQVIRKKVIILGHSFGGGVGLALASRHGSMVERLVLVDSAGIPMNMPVPLVCLKKIWEMIVQTFLPGSFLPLIQMTWVFFMNLLRNPFKIFRSIDLPNKQDLSNMIRELEIPTMVLWAKKDIMISFDKGEFMSLLLNTPLILAPESLYHDWCITHPNIFISKMETNLFSGH